MHNTKLIRSMSHKGCSPVNAAFEGFFGRLKTGLFYPWNWQGSTIEQFIEVVDSYIRWFTKSPPRSFLAHPGPREYRVGLGLMA